MIWGVDKIYSPLLCRGVNNMNEKTYKKRLDFQQKMIARQSEEIENLKMVIEKLKVELEEKDNIIKAITPMKEELARNIAQIKEYKKQYKESIDELRKMKDIINQTVYKGRWNVIRFLMK